MSLVNDNRIHAKREISLGKLTNLILTEELIDKIKLLHAKVPNGIEWSGILIYETVEGNIIDPKTWVVRAIDVIPMDIGTAAYTEYEFDAEDEYSFSLISEYLTAGKKIGHIHSHHNMQCFFSGTDTSELHDNSPNHNYYLSLIVNYKDHNAWCAKIAYCATETIQGNIVKNITYNGSSDLQNSTVEEPLSQTIEKMYTIDANIIPEYSAEVEYSDFTTRIAELNTKRLSAIKTYHRPGYPIGTQTTIHGGTGHHMSTSYLGDKKKDLSVGNTVVSQTKSISLPNDDLMFAPAEVNQFLKQWLEGNRVPSLTESSASIAGLTKQLDLNNQDKTRRNFFLDRLQEHYEGLAEAYFMIEGTNVEIHCITVSVKNLLEPYINTTPIVKEIDELLEVYLDKRVTSEECEKLTGLKFNYFEDLKSTDPDDIFGINDDPTIGTSSNPMFNDDYLSY